jgi:hypothetical protein
MPGPYDTNGGTFNVPYLQENASTVTTVADLNSTDIAKSRTIGQYNPKQNGVFGANPLMTPKYAQFAPRDAEFRDTLARLYISVADLGADARNQYLATVPAESQALATVLLGDKSAGGSGFIDFFLTSANEQFQEIMQVDKVLSDDYVAFFYGQQPPVFQYSGTLLNSMQDDQRSGFARAYQVLLRGTQLARRGALARLRYDSVIVSGVLTAHQQQLNADNELAVPFSFSFLVKEYVILQNIAFNKVTVDQYIALAAQAEIAALSPVNSGATTSVTTTVTPPTQAATSVAGAPQSTSVVDRALNAAQQLVASAVTFLSGPPPTSNIKGTIDPNPPTPPSPP